MVQANLVITFTLTIVLATKMGDIRNPDNAIHGHMLIVHEAKN
jgi:hypothetical protein